MKINDKNLLLASCVLWTMVSNNVDYFLFEVKDLQTGTAISIIRCDFYSKGFTSILYLEESRVSFLPLLTVRCCHHLLCTGSGLLPLRPSVPLPASSLRLGSDIHESDAPLRRLVAVAASLPNGCSCPGRTPES